MNRTTRLSLIAVMLLATSALGIIGYKAMHPELPPATPELPAPPPPPQTAAPKQPLPNPYYQKLVANLDQHERYCLQLGNEAMTVLDAKTTERGQRSRDCWSLVNTEREYVKNFPAKTIQ
jgi:hypothetical protein